ncbi:hypothetical protein [Ectobacillus panaciterrae]|uniref:hypothetical protein n=1 Tax=Ectobacillus panaciterrae TaxID=363872 RepID=UPI0003FD368C|nr:hypothetical protein [Ectobacillus panaciterrae]
MTPSFFAVYCAIWVAKNIFHCFITTKKYRLCHALKRLASMALSQFGGGTPKFCGNPPKGCGFGSNQTTYNEIIQQSRTLVDKTTISNEKVEENNDKVFVFLNIYIFD